MTELSACRLYLVTPPALPDLAAFATQLARTLEAGDVAALQIRLKATGDAAPSEDEIRRVVDVLRPIAWAQDVAVLLNDSPLLARDTGCDGVHIGQEDMPYAEARKILGPEAMIGVTCHDSRHLALEAAEQGADYVAFGAFFPTPTKEAKTQAEPELLTWWQDITTVPCVAIGGITPANAAALVAAGADFLAVSSGVWGWPDGPEAAVRAFNTLFQQSERP